MVGVIRVREARISRDPITWFDRDLSNAYLYSLTYVKLKMVICTKFISIVFLVALFICPIAHHQHTTKRIAIVKHADSTASAEGSRFMADPKHAGLSIGIYADGKTSTYNFGSIEKGKQNKPTANSIYEMGSITKSFMGLLLAKAVVDKKVALNDPVTKYLGPAYSNLSLNGHTIAVRDLATHTAGFDKNIPDLSKLDPAQINALFKNYSKSDFLADLKKVHPNTTPGSNFRYSNAGTQVAEIIVERIYGDSFSNLVKKYIAVSAGMKHTGTTVSRNDGNLYVNGYGPDGRLAPRPDLWKSLPAAGYLKSSINDMLKYIRFNIDERNQAVKLAHTPIFMHTDEDNADIGLFWFIKNNAEGDREVMHAGGSYGTTSFLLINPAKKKGIICFANDASASTEHELRIMAAKILAGV